MKIQKAWGRWILRRWYADHAARKASSTLRPEGGQVRSDFDRALRIGRLQNLQRYGPAREIEPGAKLKRLYDDIENGVADLSDPMSKDSIAELKAILDQARADAERGEDALDRLGPSITAHSLKKFARQACRRIRIDGGGYCRDHLRALAQRSKSTRKKFASWALKAYCCVRVCFGCALTQDRQYARLGVVRVPHGVRRAPRLEASQSAKDFRREGGEAVEGAPEGPIIPA